MAKFISTLTQVYYRGGYSSCDTLINTDEISSVTECLDDYRQSVITMKNGKQFLADEEASKIRKKIIEAEADDA
uniref:Uncharacterized protein n=1 Tax=uncultured bacterium Contig643 TaxID=1393602 RepID=W0FKR2_9BACT|nr:predicted protein [uncultured bacterium Contig643]